jgi:hypothetical protein
MAKKDKGKDQQDDAPVDLAARIGRVPDPVAPPPSPAPGPRGDAPHPPRLDGPLPPRRNEQRPLMIGMDEPAPPPLPVAPATPDADSDESTKSTAIPSPRTPPGPGEVDLVATPLPTLDDWHRFELALRRVRGVGQVRTEYYRHGVLKVRVSYAGEDRLANALRAGVPGYRVRVLGEDRSTLQILVSSEGDERRPG